MEVKDTLAYELGKRQQLVEVLNLIQAILDDGSKNINTLPASMVLAVFGKTLAETYFKEE